MRSRLKRSLATTLALLMYVQPITQSAYGAYRAKGAYSAPGAYRAPSAPLAPRAQYAPNAPYAPYAQYAPSVPVVVFGPAVYQRTAGSPNIYDLTFSKPAWMTGQYTLHVVNGTAAGANRLSSSTITLNGVEVAASSDFGQSVAGFDKNISLLAQNTMQVRVTSVPLGFMTVSILAQNGDHTPPAITFVSPVSGGFSNTTTTQIVLRATDALGLGEPGLSGILASSLAVTVDGTNRSSLFSLVNGDFVGNVPALPEGTRTVSVSIADVAGNTVSGSISFTIDRTPPQITIASPAAGLHTNANTIGVQGGIVDATTTAVVVNGVAATVSGSQFAAAAIPVGAPPTQVINVQATDAANNTATASVTINVDRTAPAVTFVSPVSGGFSNTESTQIVLRAADVLGAGELTMSAVAPATLAVSVDGANQTAAFSLVNGDFVGTLPALAEGAHSVSASIADIAGNVGNGSMSFTVDRTLPAITFVSPVSGGFSNTDGTQITFRAADGLGGIVQSTLAVTVDNANRTSLFAFAGGDFVGNVPGLPEGNHTITASISDVAGNTASGSILFTIDRTAPQITIGEPVAGHFTNAGAIQVRGGIVDATATTVTVNGAAAAMTGTQFTVGAVPVGAPPSQVITVQATDAANNTATASVTINVDRTAPAVTFVSPAPGGFSNSESTQIVLRAADALGAGEVTASSIAPATLAVTVDGANQTALLSLVNGDFVGTLPLAEGAHSVNASIADVAGNVGTGSMSFTVDRTLPAITFVSPVSGGFSNTDGTQIAFRAADGMAGVVQGTLAVSVDSTNQTSLFALVDGDFVGNVPGLPEGSHTVTASISDEAGNTASGSISFTIDRTAPQIVIVDPAQGQYTNATAIDVQGGVVDATATTVTVDGAPAVVSNSEFVAGAVPVGAGPSQIINVAATDAAGNTATAAVTINVDRAPPVLAITSPAVGAALQGPIVDVSGTVSDASTVVVTVNGEQVAVANGAFSGQVPASDGSTVLRAEAHDAAGNQSSDERTIFIDSVAPVITILEPAQDTITNQTSMVIRGSVSDSSITVVRAGGAEVPAVNGLFEATLPLPSEGSNVLLVTATDAAGNESMAAVNVISDRSAPVLSITSPAGDAVVPALPVTVHGTVQDLTGATVTVNGTPVTVTGATWETTLDNLAEGATTISVVARDAADNESSASRTLNIDLNAPVLAIDTPQSGALTADGTVAVAGTVQDVSVSAVLVNGVAATLGAAQPGSNTRAFTATVSLNEGDNAIVASATDAANREGTAQVMVTRDSTPPSIALSVGPKVTRTRPAAASVIATDNLVLDRVTVSVNGSLVQTFTAPPFVLDIAAPAGARPGDVLAIVAEATDRVGNKSQSVASLPVASDGAIVGQVLSDVTGRPIPLVATVSVDNAPAITTDESGRYSFATGEQRIGLTVTAVNMTSVDRVFDVASETGTVAVDARLTPLAQASTVGAASSTVVVTQGGAPGSMVALSLLVPGGAYPDGSSITATALSGQGLPGLLPLGWSPIAALDLRGPAPATALTMRLEIPGGTSAPSAVYLARYINRTWYLASDALTPDANGVVTVAIPSADAITVALVIPDTGDGAPTVPAIGDPLPSVAAVAIPITATSAGVLDPPVLSPSGGTSIGTLTVTSPTALPSGTIVQAVVTETFTLAGGDTISTDARTQDFVLYRTLGTQQNQTSGTPGTVETLGTLFPVTPSRSFATAELLSGIVHLDILAGREGVRGSAGGNGSVTLTTSGATLSVAQGALTQDVPIAFQSAVLSSFLSATADVSPLLEFSVDFSGRELTTGAAFSVPAAQLGTVTIDDAVVIVRIDSLEGRSRLVPVAIGELAGDRYHARALQGLPGITLGGRHVWYRVAGGVGFVRGVVDAGGTLLSALVESDGLPFVANGQAITGQYTAIARPGDRTIRAHAAGTSLAGEATASITINTALPLNISLAGTVSTATVTPAAGALNVPIAAQVDVTAPVSIDTDAAAAAAITFTRTSDPSGPVAYRRILSGSGRTLAIVPLTRLAEGATYSITVTGLLDVVDGAILVPPTTFSTQSTTSPVYNLDQLVFSFPNDQGEVILNGPPGTLAPGSTILIVNESTGEVSTLGVNNDGSVSEVGGRLIANISDRLIVTITDLQGRQTIFKRSEYVAPDGTTAVGNGGGEIVAPGGVEVRIPEDAVMNGVAAILKIAAISPDQLPSGPLPDLPGATVSTSLKLESPDPPQFQKEVDLVFPKPANAPENAVYFVYRRMEGPDGKIAYEAIDYADVEGEGENAKVVTASYPFSGYQNSTNGYSANGLDVGGAVSNQFTNYAILMFHFDQLMPGRALGGVITGKVLRPKWNPGATTPTYEPVAGAIVSGVDAAGDPLFAKAGPDDPAATFATSQADGTYSLFDRQYTGGALTMSATYGGQTFKATAYEVDPQNTKSPGLRFARNVATANITFPAVAPAAPPSPVTVAVMTLDTNGARKNSTGIVIAGEPLVIGVKAGGMTVQRIQVKNGSNTTEYGVRVDPQAAQNPAAFEVIADGAVAFALPGSYTVTATALNPEGGVAVGYVVVRAAAPGGGNNDSLPNDAPAVITARTSPKADAVGVQIGALPQIVFTEPVQNVPDGVILTEEGGGTIGVMLSGVGPNGPIASLTSASIVTSITIQPTAGLKFGTRYTLSLSSAIVDTDDGANNTQAQKPLTPYSTSFTSFAPESIGQTTDNFTAGGMAVIGDRAFIATPQNLGRWFTNLRLFDISDPTAPQEIGSDTPSASQVLKAPPAWWLGLPVDVAVDEESPLTGGPVVAVAVTPLAYPYHTSNVRLYDVSNDQQWRWIGAVSLGREPSDGMIRRIEMKGSMLYAVTAGVGKGIQFVDLGSVQGAFDTALAQGEQSAAYWHMLGQLNSMEGFAQEAIVQTIPVNTGTGDNSQLWDLAVTGLPINGITQTAVVATGRSSLVVANQTDGLLYNGDITDGQGGGPLTSWGYGVAAGTVAGMPIAAVAAIGIAGPASATNVLAIVDLTNPSAPRATKIVALPGSAAAVQEVVLRDTNVFVATNSGTYIVSVSDPENPALIGSVPGMSGRLAFGSDGLVFSTYRGLTQVTHADGGLKSAALESMAIIRQITATDVLRQQDQSQTARPVAIEFALLPTGSQIGTASVELTEEGLGASVVATLTPDQLNGGSGRATWPVGSRVNPGARYFAQVRLTDGATGELMLSQVKQVPVVHQVLDLEIQSLPEEYVAGRTELSPGGVVGTNTDDDNNDGQPDSATVTTAPDDDLVPVKLKAAPELLKGVNVTLTVRDAGQRIRVWLEAGRRTAVATGTSWVAGATLPSIIYVEGLKASALAGDVELALHATDVTGKDHADVVRISVIEADLDIDSTNDSGFALPTRTPAQDSVEDQAGAGRTGKVLAVNSNDDDEDGITDFADGFNRDPGAAPAAAKDDLNVKEHFTPLVLQLSPAIDLATARVRFTYNASLPAAVTKSGAEPEFQYVAGTGSMRLWKKAGSQQRNALGVAAGGDFVTAAVGFEPAALGYTAGQRTVTLYVESTAASAALAEQRVVVDVDPDGLGPLGFVTQDAIRVTAVELRVRDDGESRPVAGGGIAWILADPTPAMPRLRVTAVPALGNTVNADWSMVTANKDNGRQDEVHLPVGAQSQVTKRMTEEWDIADAITALPEDQRYFGGNATVSVKVAGLLDAKIQFRIRGRNPADQVARQYIDSHAAPADAWFAYAIAKHESKDGNQYYHQFLRLGSTYANDDSTGLPLFRPNPAGWGLMQLDFTSSGLTTRPTMAEIWNWQANVLSGLQKLSNARTVATDWMTLMRPGRVATRPAGQRPQSHIDAGGGLYRPDPNGDGRFGDARIDGGVPVAVPGEIAANCTFADGTPKVIEDAVTMKAYNGARRHYVAWDSVSRSWAFVRTNDRGRNYVAQVCAEVEP